MLVPLRPGFQRYAWGDTDTIPGLFDFAPSGEPFAEAWLGAHPALPAVATLGERSMGLDALIAGDQAGVLGRRVAEEFGGLPYLLKVLAAARPLSIQVHPSRAQAEAGFARENAAGIPLSAPERNYRDANHKPELIVALTPFDALCGFPPLPELSRRLAALPELCALLPVPEPTPHALRAWMRQYFELPADELRPSLARLVDRLRADALRAKLAPDSAEHWVLVAADEFSTDGQPDVGLPFVLLLNLVHLEPGQGLYLPAGVPHAYLDGAGIEVMASSDNVLRAGLTPKHVDPKELCAIVDFSGGAPPRVEVTEETPVLSRYVTPAAEFELSVLRVGDARPNGLQAPPSLDLEAHGPETLLVTGLDPDGVVRVLSDDRSLTLRRGGACLVGDATRYSLSASQCARVWRVRVP